MLYNEVVAKEGPGINCGDIITYGVYLSALNNSSNGEFVGIKYAPDDIAYCIFTSGSIGNPKGVLLTYRGILNHIQAKISLMKLTSENRFCFSFNTGFVASIWQILTPILLGTQLYIYDNDLVKRPYHFLRQLEKDKVNVVSMIPQSLNAYCKYIGGVHPKLKLPDMKYIILTGEKVDKDVVEKFYGMYKHIALINAYGQTECSDDTFHFIIPNDIAFDSIPIGQSIQNITFNILNENKEKVATGEKGELYISGDCLSQGYLNDEEMTSKKFVTISGVVYFRTGDIVKSDGNGNVVYIGRSDNQIKIRGYRIELEEIEGYLNQTDGVEQSIVIAIDTDDSNKTLTAFYTSENKVNVDAVKKQLSKKLPEYMISSTFKRVESFLYNANGKMDRNRVFECVEIKTDTKSLGASNLDDLNAIQRKAFKVITSTLASKAKDITITTPLEENIIDSITFISIVVALENEFDFEFDDEMLLLTNFSTLKAMIEYVESKVT